MWCFCEIGFGLDLIKRPFQVCMMILKSMKCFGKNEKKMFSKHGFLKDLLFIGQGRVTLLRCGGVVTPVSSAVPVELFVCA